MTRTDRKLLIIFVFVIGFGAAAFFYLQHLNSTLDDREHNFDTQITTACAQIKDSNAAFNHTLDVLTRSTIENTGLTQAQKTSTVLALTGLHLKIPTCPNAPEP